jgi:hypothetical protein
VLIRQFGTHGKENRGIRKKHPSDGGLTFERLFFLSDIPIAQGIYGNSRLLPYSL